MRSLTTAATGMFAQQMNVEVISNNIANATTTGYKRRRAEFADLLYQDMRRVGTQSSDTGTIVRRFAAVGSSPRESKSSRIPLLTAVRTTSFTVAPAAFFTSAPMVAWNSSPASLCREWRLSLAEASMATPARSEPRARVARASREPGAA